MRKLDKKTIARFWSKVDRSQGTEGCWPWTGGVNAAGYGVFYPYDYPYLAHRIAWILAHDRIPKGYLVCHHCDNPPCVNTAHLFVGTQTENMRDASRKGRLRAAMVLYSRLHPESIRRGEDHHNAKLTWEQVREIRKRHASDIGVHVDRIVTHNSLALEYGVSPHTISDIILGKRWKEGTVAKQWKEERGI